jgi:hypothetical protein
MMLFARHATLATVSAHALNQNAATIRAMNDRLVVSGLIGGGLCLLILGAAWNQVVPSSAYWTPEKAEEFSAAQTDLHSHLDHSANHEHAYSAAKDRFIKIRDELESARGTRSRIKTIITSVGVTLLALAVLIHWSVRQGR